MHAIHMYTWRAGSRVSRDVMDHKAMLHGRRGPLNLQAIIKKQPLTINRYLISRKKEKKKTLKQRINIYK